MTYQCSVPGKLFIAGEYAVVKGFHAIIVPTLLRIHFEIKDSNEFLIISNQWKECKSYHPNNISNNDIWEKALHTAYSYLEENNVPAKISTLFITSEFDKLDHKFGLGTSGAIVVGIIKTILAFHKINISPLLLYKLGIYALKDEFNYASYGDIACSAFDKSILYKKDMSINVKLGVNDFIQTEWSELIIEPINKTFDVVVVHTNESASSSSLVKTLNQNLNEFNQQLIYKVIDKHVLKFLEFHNDGETDKALNQIRHLESLSSVLNQSMHDKMYSSNIKRIFDFARNKGVMYKVSGAGGGDNVILFVRNKKQFNDIVNNLPTPFMNITGYIKGVSYE